MSFLNESGLTRYDGKLKNLLASTYSTSATYDVGDYCIHGGSLYKCTTAIAAAEAWTSGHWTKVNLGNEIDAAKEDLEKLKLDVADAYSASDSHAVGDYVVRNGILYRCTTAIGSGGETWNAAHWTVVNIGDELVAIKADIGILKEDLADAYSSSKTYAVGDYCLKDGVLYRCTSAISTAEAWTSGHWTAVQVGEELCALNGAITSIGDVSITHDGKIYDNANVIHLDTPHGQGYAQFTLEPTGVIATRTSSDGSTWTPWYILAAKNINRRTNANMVFIGDSWTVGGSASTESKRFSSLVASKLQMQEFNFGIGGAGFIRTGNLFSTQLSTASSQMTSVQKLNTGIVLICGGVNDLRNMMGTSTASDFANAVVSACNTAHTIFANALIVLAISNSESDGFTADQKYWVTNAIQEAERQITDYPYLIIRNLAASVNGVTANYISDGLHLNDRGHSLFAGFIANAIMGGGQDVYYRIGAIAPISPAYTDAGGNLWRMNDDIILEASDFVFGATISTNTTFATLPTTIISPNSTAYFPSYKSNQQNGTLAITKSGNLNFIPSPAGTENYTGMLTGNVRWIFTAKS